MMCEILVLNNNTCKEYLISPGILLDICIEQYGPIYGRLNQRIDLMPMKLVICLGDAQSPLKTMLDTREVH